MATVLYQLLHERGITWDAERNLVACLAHVINLAVKEFLATLKIQSRSPEDEWAVLEFKARSAPKNPHQRYQIKGNNPFDRAIQKIQRM